MFKHILLPTDGSELSQATARRAVSFAKEAGADIVAFHAKPDFSIAYFAQGVALDPPIVNSYVRRADDEALKILGDVEALCREAGVRCTTQSVTSDSPHEAIIKAAEQDDCDLIFMASHGRGGLGALLLGSETNKVLTHSKIPVLVYR